MIFVFITLKKDLFGCFRGERDKDNETGLKEGGGIEMSTTVLPLRDVLLLHLNTYRLCIERFCFFVTVAAATSCTVTFGFDGGDIGAVTEPCRYGFESDVAERGGGSAMVVHLLLFW